MRAIQIRKRLTTTTLALCWLLGSTPILCADPAPKVEKPPTTPAARSPQEFLASPRETLKTLYFAVVAYDLQPQLIDEAVACLDLDAAQVVDRAETARLAIELEQTLRMLCIPISSIPLQPNEDVVILQEGGGTRIALSRGSDNLWRFDRATVNRIPAMNRDALAHFHDMQQERNTLRDQLTDPSATMRRFLMDTIARDFYSAANCLDLSGLDPQERSEKGPLLARQLAFVVQRRGWVFMQEVPNQPSAPPYTWHADLAGRIVLERVRGEDGKEAWLFSKKTVRNLPAMFAQDRKLPADPRYVRIHVDLTEKDLDPALSEGRPGSVPDNLGSPRALLQGFFKAIEDAQTEGAPLAETLIYLDLRAIPPADRAARGIKLAGKLDVILRKIHVDLSALPADWNAPTQVLGTSQGVRVEIVRQRDGCWRISQGTVSQIPMFFDALSTRDSKDQDRVSRLDSARATMSEFLTCLRRGDDEGAANCLDLSDFRPGTAEGVGAVLAYKLKYVMDRIGRVYIQEVPDTPDGPGYVFYRGERGEQGRIILARVLDGPRKGCWLFTKDTVAQIEPMFRTFLHEPINEACLDKALPAPTFWRTPGLWVRCCVPEALRAHCWCLQLYQWLGLGLAILLSALVSRVLLAQVHRLVALILRKSGSVLTQPYVAARLRPLTWVTTWWMLFHLLTLLDLPVHVLNTILPLKTFGMAGLIAWFGMQFVDLATAIYMNSELLRPHRSLSDMVVPVSMRALKGVILLLVAVYIVYEVGQGDSLTHFLTGLGVLGLAASLAAQDGLKSFFSTLLLIGERSFKIGDRIMVNGVEGMVEQVGFRATRLRTPDGSLLTIPNSTIASAPIDNLTTKAFSRCKMSLLVNYDTSPLRIMALRDHIRTWLQGHPKIHADRAGVSVNRLTGEGVEVTLDLLLTNISGEDEQTLKEEINCEVLRLCESLGSGDPSSHHPLSGGQTGEGAVTGRRAA
jgi:MscS family membrane protein